MGARANPRQTAYKQYGESAAQAAPLPFLLLRCTTEARGLPVPSARTCRSMSVSTWEPPSACARLRSNNRALQLAKDQRTAANDALGKAVREIREAADKEQDKYDAKTDHGRNQAAVGGVNTVLLDGIPLAP